MLPKVPTPRANYNNACQVSPNLLFTLGHSPITNEGDTLTGIASGDNPEGKHAANFTGLSMIATLKRALGDNLGNVE